MAAAWESAPLVDGGQPDKKKSSAATPENWDEINAASKAAQPGRDSERLAILEDEYRNETNPANRAALEREIKRAGATAPKQQKPAWMDAPEVTEDASGTKKTDKSVQPTKSGAEDVSDNPVVGALAGIGSGVGKVAMGAQHYLGKGLDAIGLDKAGQWLVEDAAKGRAKLKSEVDPYKEKSPIATGGGELAGEIASTWPVGGLLSKGVQAVSSAPRAVQFAKSLASSGATTGNSLAKTASLGEKAADMGLRVAGGATTGGVSAGLVNPDDAAVGAVVGGITPPTLSLLSKAGNAVGGLVRPFYKGGQERIVGNTLREFATNPEAALTNLRNAREVIPGSAPTTIMAAGDEGLAGLSRTLQSQSGQYAGELSARQAAQNAARTKAIEDVAGNTGKISLAEKARDEATAAMRESVLDSAGKLPAEPVLSSIDGLIKKPDNAGKLAQQALNEFRGRIAQFAPDGEIDARALYAIRKDINDVLGGKLQGEAGNMRHASSQLIKVKGLIDDAIDKASRAVQPVDGRALMPYGSNVTVNAAPYGSTSPRPTWSQYLQEYSKLSKPIEQMKELDDVLRRIQTGTVDQSGNAVLSAAKLNNLLKNDSQDLAKKLTDDQLDLLRRLSADLNASQLANNAGRAVGSNTVQNLAQGNLLKDVLGKSLGGGALATSTLGRLMQLPYGAANQQIVERLGSSLLDPKEAARLLQTPEGSKLLRALSNNAQIGYKAAPVLSAQ